MSNPSSSVEVAANGEASGASPLPESTEGAGNLDRVRDILFGAHVRENDQKVRRLEEKVAADLAGVREDARKRADSLEQFVRDELDALEQRLATERAERGAALLELGRELKALLAGLDQKLTQMEEQTHRRQRELRQALFEQGNSLRDDLLRESTQLSSSLAHSVRDLDHRKTDRQALAGLLSDLAERISRAGLSGDE